MASIIIRDMPEEVHTALKAQAEQNRRSKEKQALYLIETGLRRKMPIQEALAQARRLHDQFRRRTSIRAILAATEETH
jgi:plasmid stability protein